MKKKKSYRVDKSTETSDQMDSDNLFEDNPFEENLIEDNCVKREVSISLSSSLTYRTTSVQSLAEVEAEASRGALVWHNVRYVVEKKGLKKSKMQTIELVRNASGTAPCGKVTALLGPSGTGKTTLLECIAGLRTVGLTGNIYVTSGPKTKIAFCGQMDHHLEELTVYETLLFATRIKNYNKNKKNVDHKWDAKEHKWVVDNVMKQLGLESCAKVRVQSCSGGQRKRLSIGVELVSRPNILFLDEPTSGLDSSSCFQVVKLLQSLSRGSQGLHPMVVVASLHQPSAQVLNRIDYLYVMSTGGRPIYSGPTAQLTQSLNSFGLSCPIYETPSDFLVSVASGDHGITVIERMVFNETEKSGYFHEVPEDSTPVLKIVEKSRRRSHPFFMHFWQLLLRTNLTIWRQPQLTGLRLFTTLAIAAMLSVIFVNPIGQSGGCVMQMLMEFDLMRPMGDDLSNLGFIFFSLLFIALSAKMPTILTFPLEMNVLLRERANGWYSCGAYYIAKSIADIPYQIAFPLIYCSIVYFTTYQILEFWRLSVFFVVNIIIAFISQSVGLVIGAFFADDFTSAIYAAALVIAPLLFFTGFLVPFRDIRPFLHPLSNISWFKFGMQALVITIYGFDRCQQNNSTPYEADIGSVSQPLLPDMDKLMKLWTFMTDNNLFADAIWFLNRDLIDQMREQMKMGGSLIMQFYVLQDSQLWTALAALIAFMAVIRFIGYYVLLWKVNANK